jgi:hypothetical protein
MREFIDTIIDCKEHPELQISRLREFKHTIKYAMADFSSKDMSVHDYISYIDREVEAIIDGIVEKKAKSMSKDNAFVKV